MDGMMAPQIDDQTADVAALTGGRARAVEHPETRVGRDLAELIWDYTGDELLEIEVPAAEGAVTVEYRESFLFVRVPREIGFWLASWLYALYEAADEWPRKKIGDCAFSLACSTGLFDDELGEWQDEYVPEPER